jgi:glycosyltransferase involved in cell wall biosynthesis
MPDPSDPTARNAPEPAVLVVVPAWNEEGAIAATIADIRAMSDGEILVVDDGSTDRTAVEATRAGALVCSLPYNLGVGGAMRTGYRYALRHGYDVVVQIDADGQHDPRYLPLLIAQLAPMKPDGADLVVGARFAGEGSTYRVSLPRRFAMRLLAVVLSRLAHTKLTDVTSGYRVANRRAVELFAAHYPAEYLGDTVESMVIALKAGCRVAQVPVEMRTRQAGQPSQTPFRAAVFLARALVALSLALIRRWPGAPSDTEPITPTSVSA